MIRHVEQKSVSQVLPDDKIIYKIPKYQRKYTWGQNEWDLLFNDVIENDEGYFLGSTICVALPGSAFGATYLEVIEGYDGFENQKRPVAAIPAGVKNLIVGVPSNMEFELFLTDDTILHSPARIKIEHYDSAGVYKGCSEVQKIYLNMYSACKFKIGKELLDKDKVQHKSLTYKERKEFVNIANLKPEYHFRVYPEFTYGLNNNITAGIHYGIPILYGTALLNYNLSNANKGFDFIAGIGNKIAFYGKYSLDVELLEKTCIFSSSADTDKKLSFVPEVKLSLSKNIIAKTTSCVSFAFDFNINDFNNDAFFSDIRKQRFGSWKINSNLKVYPSIQFGIRF